jgi:hypothetical protein
MTKAIQCDICRKVAAQGQAYNWRSLTLKYAGFVTGDGYNEGEAMRADVCSAECARIWFDRAVTGCFRSLEQRPRHNWAGTRTGRHGG